MPLPDGVASDPRWQLTQRILESEQFRKANRLRSFLSYVVERTIEERVSEISEQQIGVHVFGRKPDYNASEDNVVRSQARLLRLKLESYFANGGAGEELTLSIPRGTYVPAFSPRRAMEPAADPPRSPARSWTLPGAIVVLVFLAIAAGVWLARPAHPSAVEWTRDQFWRKVFTNTSEHSAGVLVIPADASYGLAQEVLGRRITLAEYLSPAYGAEWEAAAIRKGLPRGLAGRSLTAYDSTMNVGRIFRTGTGMGVRLELRPAREVQHRDVRLASLILLGSARDNPWLETVEARLPFRLAWRHGTPSPVLIDREPAAGYRPEPSNGREGLTHYAHIALLANEARTGSVLVIGGTSEAAADLAGSLLSNATLFAEAIVPALREAAKGRTATGLPYFQAVLRAKGGEGQTLTPEMVAVRCLE